MVRCICTTNEGKESITIPYQNSCEQCKVACASQNPSGGTICNQELPPAKKIFKYVFITTLIISAIMLVFYFFIGRYAHSHDEKSFFSPKLH